MTAAIKWGVVFGLGQAGITIFMAIITPHDDILIMSNKAFSLVACFGQILSFIIAFATGLVATIAGKKFIYGLVAALIGTVFDLLASILGFAINPSFLNMPLTLMTFSYAFSVMGEIGLSAAGAGVGVAINRNHADASDQTG